MRMNSLTKVLSCLLLLALFVLSLAACALPSPDGGTETPDNGENNTPSTPPTDEKPDGPIDRTDPSAGTYQINFCLGETASFVTHYYNEGETVTPPETLPSITVGTNVYVFDGWEGVTFAVVSGNATYRSNYKVEANTRTVSYVLGDEVIEVKVLVGGTPTVPDISEFHLADGEQFCAWDKTVTDCQEDTTVYAIVTKYFDPTYFLAAYNRAPMSYTSSLTANDNANGTTNAAGALTCLLVEENQNPKGGAVAMRIVENLTSVVQKDQAPAFDACCYWSYCPLSGSIAMAKATPTVWDIVPVDIKLRLDTMMRAFAYLESFATSDFNAYKTGPGMLGNYSKTWNPNYRMANIPVMVYVTSYFGNGDMNEGADLVNSFLKGFNEEKYNEIINLFQKYGWRRAMLTWTADGVLSSNGATQGRSAKELLLYGGLAVGDDTSTASDLKVALGEGVGVTNGGKDYLYGGFSLKESDWIIRSLLMHNYGDNGLSKGNLTAKFLEVKSDHWYDIDGDGVKEIVAWIMSDNDTSPYEGQYGMMKEFASGDRSSTSYCSHDFLLTTTIIATCKVLGIYDLATDEYCDPNGVNIREAIIVGNEDFLYKNEQGYQGYATGSYGTSTSSHSEKTEDKGSYFALKSLWRLTLKPELEQVLAGAEE